MKSLNGNVGYLAAAVFAMMMAIGVFAMICGLAFDERAMLGDADVRWKVLGALATASAMVVAVATLVQKGWVERRDPRRRAQIVSIEIEGLIEGDEIEGVVLPGGAIRMLARTPAACQDNVVPITRSAASNVGSTD